MGGLFSWEIKSVVIFFFVATLQAFHYYLQMLLVPIRSWNITDFQLDTRHVLRIIAVILLIYCTRANIQQISVT